MRRALFALSVVHGVLALAPGERGLHAARAKTEARQLRHSEHSSRSSDQPKRAHNDYPVRTLRRIPMDTTHGALCAAGPNTSSLGALFRTARDVLEELYDVRNTSWVPHGDDTSAEWGQEPGSVYGWIPHTYGEVTRAGMFRILHRAACIAGPAECARNKTTADLVALFRRLHFYDLGSGQGKFPMLAALLGFEYAHGAELDGFRAEYAAGVARTCTEMYPCLAGKLGVEHGNFLAPASAWTAVPGQRRIVFVDALFFESMWDRVEHALKMGMQDWGRGSVVVSLGRALKTESTGLHLVVKSHVNTSWSFSKGVPVLFYQFGAEANAQIPQARVNQTAERITVAALVRH